MSAGSDITAFTDYGTDILQVDFFQDAEDTQVTPDPLTVTYSDVGSYTVNLVLVNRRSYATATVTAEVDELITDIDVTCSHTEFNSQTCITVTATAGTRITVFWILDDGFALENFAVTYTDLAVLCNTYSARGIYVTEIRVSNSLVYYHKTCIVAVVDRMVGLSFTVPPSLETSEALQVTRMISVGDHVTCELDFGDGFLEILYQEATTSPITFSHTYSTPGMYNVAIMVTNYLETETFLFTVAVQNAVAGLTLTSQTPKAYGGDMQVDFVMTAGTNNTCTAVMEYDTNGLIHIHADSIYHEIGSLSSFVLISDSIYTALTYDIKINCSNLVSFEERSATVSVDKIISGSYLNASVVYGIVDGVYTLYLGTINGSRYSYVLDYGDGTTPGEVSDGTEPIGPYSQSPTHQYAIPGYFTPTVTISNSVSEQTVSTEIGIEYEILDFSLWYENKTFVSSDVVIKLKHNGPSNEPTSVLVIADFGDGVEITEPLNLQSSEHTITHRYPYEGYFTLNVTMINNVSRGNDRYTVMIGRPIVNLLALLPDPVEYPIRREPSTGSEFSLQQAFFTIKVDEGSSIYFTLQFGDGSDFSFQRTNTFWDSSDEQDIPHTYSEVGLFYGFVSAKNNLTDVLINATTPIPVTVQNPVPTLSLDPIGPQKLNHTVNTTFILNIDPREYTPTNCSCHWTYGDLTQETLPMVMDETTKSYQHNHIFDVQPGEHQTQVDCTNKVSPGQSSTVVQALIMYQRSINGLTVGTYNNTVEQGRPATIWINITYGSHVVVEVDYGDDSGNVFTNYVTGENNDFIPFFSYPNDPLEITHVYAEGNYTFNVTLHNAVSNSTVYAPQIFIIQYKIGDLLVSSNSPYEMVYPESPGTIFIDVEGQRPTDPFATFTFPMNAREVLYCGQLNRSEQFNVTHIFPYATIGTRKVEVKITNYINYIFRSIDVDVIERIDNLNLTTRQTPTINQCAYNVSQTIIFKLNVQNGSRCTAILNTKDGYLHTQDGFEVAPWEWIKLHSYSTDGKYNVSVEVTNLVSSDKAWSDCGELTIQYPIPPLRCKLNSTIIAYPPGNFNVTIGLVDTAERVTDPYVSLSYPGLPSPNITYAPTKIQTSRFNELYTIHHTDRALFGNHSVTLNISNLVSSSEYILPFTMEEIIRGLQFFPNMTSLRVNEQLNITSYLSHGTHVRYIYDFDSESSADVTYVHYMPDPLDCRGNTTATHTYREEGNYTVNITAVNDVSSQDTRALYQVMATIKPLNLSVLNTIIKSPPGIVNFSLCYPSTDEVIPRNIFITSNLGDGSPNVRVYSEAFVTAQDRCYNWGDALLESTKSGIFFPWSITENIVSSMNSTTVYYVYRIAVGAKATTPNKTVVSANVPLTIVCSIAEGSNMTVIANYGDGNSSEPEFLAGYHAEASVNFTHIYTVNGTYEITCNFTNVVSMSIGNCSIDVEWPIPEDINITYPAVVPNPPGTFNWSIDFSVKNKPLLDFFFKLGETESLVLRLTSWPQYPEQDLVVDGSGDRNFTLRFTNRVSFQEKLVMVHFQEPVENVTLECPVGNTTTSWGIATEVMESFTCHKNTGSHVNLYVDFGDESTEVMSWDEDGTSLNIFNHSYAADGDYTVKVMVYNDVSSVNASCSISAFDKVSDITLSAMPVNSTVNASVQFDIFTDDGVTPPSRALVTLQANDSSPEQLRNFTDNGVSINRTFYEPGKYLVTAKIQNGYNAMVLQTVVTVIHKCRSLRNFTYNKALRRNKPESFNVTFDGPVNDLCVIYVFSTNVGQAIRLWRGTQRLCAEDPLFVANKYEDIPQGALNYTLFTSFTVLSPLDITVTVKSNCFTTTTEYTANITDIPCLRLEFTDITRTNGSTPDMPMLLKKSEPMEVSDEFFALSEDCESPAVHFTVYENTTAGRVELPSITVTHKQNIRQYVMEGGSFTFAEYILDCYAHMPQEPFKNASKTFFFKVVKSPISVSINRDSLTITTGKEDDTVLQAITVDPDEEGAPWIFKWFCWKEGDKGAIGSSKIRVPKSAEEVPTGSNGCFGDQSGQLNVSGSSFTLYGDTMEIGKYVIKVDAEIGSRKATYEVNLEVLALRQLEVYVEVKWTKPTVTQLLSIQDEDVCAECKTCASDTEYTWKVATGDVDSPVDTLSPLPDNAYTKTGKCIKLQKAYIVPLKQYSFECSVLSDGNGGQGSMKTCSADKPANGKLEIHPREGTAIATEFSVKASGWTIRKGTGCTFDKPSSVGLEFSYFQSLGNGEKRPMILTNSKTPLPEGLHDGKDPVDVSVRVRSTYNDMFLEIYDFVKVDAPANLSAAISSIKVTSTKQKVSILSAMSAMKGEDINLQIMRLAVEVQENPDEESAMALSTLLAVGDMDPTLVFGAVNMLDVVHSKEAYTIISSNFLTAIYYSVPVPIPQDFLQNQQEDPDAVPEEDLGEAYQFLQQSKKIADDIQNTLEKMIPPDLSVNESSVIGDENSMVQVAQMSTKTIPLSTFLLPFGGSLRFPPIPTKEEILNFMVIWSAQNHRTYVASAVGITAGTITIDVTKSDGSEASMPSIEGAMDIGIAQSEGKNNWVNLENSTVDPKTLVFSIYIQTSRGQGAFVMEITVGRTYDDTFICIEVYIKFNITANDPRQPDMTHYDFRVTLPHSTGCNHTLRTKEPGPEDDWVVIVPEKYLGPPGMSVAMATKIEDNPKPLNITPPDVGMRTAITRCRSWNNLDQEWTSESCVVGKGTTMYKTNCKCDKLTDDLKTFSGGITLPTVNTIDFANIFANFSSLLNANPTVLATLLCLFCCYIILLVWARRKDRLDLERWGVTPLVDNLVDNTYFFKMSVYTGLRQNAGTKSKICFILSGDQGDTGVRILDDGHGKFFGRGALRHFILSTNVSLGPLNFMRIWHDNSGEGASASWFLDKILLEDLQIKKRYMFLCGRWLAVDEDDGQVDRSLPVAGEEEVDGFEHLFFSTARRNLTDEHLWISVLSRPTKSHFSRAQRLTCCLTLLFTTMLASAMFYQGTPEQAETVKSDEVIRIGPLVLSVQTLVISIYANLLVVPINLLVVQFFRKSKPRHYVDIDEAERTAVREEMRRQRYMATEENDKNKDSEDDNQDKDNKGGKKDKDKKKDKTKKWPKYPLPWWCVIIAWVLATVSCAISMFIVFMYSLEWGKLVSEEWLSSLLFSFVQSVIVIQPLKVVAVAMLVSLIFKKYTGEEEDEEDKMNKERLASDEELVTAPDVDLNTLAAPAAPSAKALAEARAKAAMEKRMWATVREVVTYLVFLLLVAFIAWGPRDENMFIMTNSMKDYMAGSDKLKAPNNNETIGFLGDPFRFWLWMNTTVVDCLYNTVLYNGKPTTRRERFYMRDQVSFRVGAVRMRQLRIPPAECQVPSTMRAIVLECNIPYEIHKEEDRNFTAGWYLESSNATEPPAGSIDLAFKFHSMLDLNSFPLWGKMATYGGGGYVADLGDSPGRARLTLHNLMKANWVDYYTRAVIVEFTIYNVNVNLFAHTSYIIEFPPTGSNLHTPKISTFQVYSGVGGMGTAVLVAQIIYIIVMFYFMVRAVKAIRKDGSKAYFKEPWNIYEMVVIVSSLICIAMFAMKEAFGRLVTKQLTDNRDGYSSYLQLATYIELVDFTVGFIVFMANIKFLRLLRFNTHVRQLAETFRLAGHDLLYFGASFFLVFGAFTMSAGLLFGTQMYGFSDLLQTLQSLYGIILGKVNFVAMRNAQPILGPVFFLTFLGMVFFILVNMFVSILTSAYTMVRLSEMKSEDDELVPLFLQRLKAGFGMQKTHREIGTGYVEPADLLDRRLDIINTWINDYCKAEIQAKKITMGKTSAEKQPITKDTKKPKMGGMLNF